MAAVWKNGPLAGAIGSTNRHLLGPIGNIPPAEAEQRKLHFQRVAVFFRYLAVSIAAE